jgi:pyruvate-formate lyase-activating enzyme
MNDLDYWRQVLNPISKSFCAAKWYNATIWLGSGQTTSCHHPPAHSINLAELADNPKLLHNTPQKKQDREMMQKGQRPAGCEYCWRIEDMGQTSPSDRVYKSKIYPIADLHRAAQTPPEQDIDLKTLEISFDRTCQFACSYCNPAFSSTWVNDLKRNGPYMHLVSDGRNHFTHEHSGAQLYKFGEENSYVDAFFKWWESDLHQTLQELRITGGEPLMSGYTWRLIDWFRNNPGRSSTRLAINSNLGMPREKIQQLLEACQGIELDIYTSNESMGTQAEYIRDGLVWQQWVDNMEYILDSGQVHGLHVMCTINATCLETLPEFLNYLIEWKKKYGISAPSFTLNILRFPSFQSPLVLPEHIREHHRQQLLDFLAQHNGHNYMHEHEIAHITRLYDYLAMVKTPHSESFDMPTLYHDFKQFHQQYDIRRGKKFVLAFPNLAEWYNSL